MNKEQEIEQLKQQLGDSVRMNTELNAVISTLQKKSGYTSERECFFTINHSPFTTSDGDLS